jgi:hypothetical protein
VSNLPSYEVAMEDPARTWEQGRDEVALGFWGCGWRSPTARIIYLELYRSLTHGLGLCPDDALSTLGAAYKAAESDVHG